MPNKPPSRTQIQSMLRTPNIPAVVPDTSSTANIKGVQTTTGATPPNKGNIGDLITHIAKSDNHLWQALTALQAQTNDLAGNTTSWTSWVPNISDFNGNPLFVDQTAAYYLVQGQLLFIELYAFLFVSTNRIVVSLPIDVGSIVIKTCAGYLFENTYDFVGLAGIQIVDNVALVYAAPSAVGTDCTLMMGGAIAIL